MVNRIDRIAEEMRKEVSNIIQNDLKDPRLPTLISVTAIKTAKDLKHAKVFVSVLGTEEQKNKAIDALKSAAGYIRRELSHRIEIRSTPELHFELDNSIEHGAYITKLINDTISPK